MRYLLSTLVLTGLLISCGNEKKNASETSGTEKDSLAAQELDAAVPKFESDLIDWREVDLNYNEEFGIQKFGMRRINDSVFAYVFRLKKDFNPDNILKYSIGIKAYLPDTEDFMRSSYSPEIQVIDNNSYLLMPHKFGKIRYLDSIESYIYARNNWKASGRLGTIKIRDILFE